MIFVLLLLDQVSQDYLSEMQQKMHNNNCETVFDAYFKAQLMMSEEFLTSSDDLTIFQDHLKSYFQDLSEYQQE